MHVSDACIAIVAGSDMRHDGMQPGSFVCYPSIGAGFHIVFVDMTNGNETARSGFHFTEADNEAEWYEFEPFVAPVVNKWGAPKPDPMAGCGPAVSEPWTVAEPDPAAMMRGQPINAPVVSKWGKPSG